jgi:uncharacterized protein (DUF2062 family)
MQEDRTARFRQAARDPRAQAVLATVASVWEKLANQRGYQRVSRHMADLVYRLDATPATRAALVPVGSARDRR